MRRLIYFNPENDAALASGMANFTAPRAAVGLRTAGESLALWYGHPGDRFVSTGINGNWYRTVTEAFGMSVDVYYGNPEGLVPAPWGWSAAVRWTFLEMGLQSDVLPDDSRLNSIRALSNRATALTLTARLRSQGLDVAGSGTVATDIATALSAVAAYGRAMIKQPWSSSGRGVFDTGLMQSKEVGRLCLGTIRRYGSVIVEPFRDEAIDCALLFEMADGTARYTGLSVFETDSHNTYVGSTVAADHILDTGLRARFGTGRPYPITDTMTSAVADALTDIIGTAYSGPLGIDLLLTPHGDSPAAIAEINLRNTMGHLCHCFAKRFLGAGLKAHFSVERNTPRPDSCPLALATVAEGRLTAGTMQLNPPSCSIAFVMHVDRND